MNLAPEKRIVIGIIRSFLRVPGAEAGPPSFREGVNRERLLALLRFHRLVPLADYVLSRGGAGDTLPSSFLDALKRETRESSARALFLEAHHQALGEVFRQRGIPFIVLKGPAIACEYYDPPYLRPYGDIDILIRYGDFPRMRDLLADQGFVPENPNQDRFTRESVKAVPYTHSLYPGLSLDLQWETVTLYWGKRPFLSSEEAWKSVHDIQCEGMSFPGLDPSLLVPYLCVHLMSHHHFSPLVNLVDIGLVLRDGKAPVDWEAVLKIAGEQDIRSALYYPLRFLRNSIGVSIPESVLKTLEPGLAVRGLFPSGLLALRSAPLPRWAERTVKFFLIDSWRERMKALGTFYRYRVISRPASGG